MKCILHIGVEKTGSTSIQKAFQGFDDGSAFYADLDRPNHSFAFEYMFRLDDNFRQALFAQGLTPENVVQEYECLLAEALDRNRETVIFSAENLSKFGITALRNLRRRLEKACDSFQVVMFVRDPLRWTASLVQEHSKFALPLDEMRFPSFQERYRNISAVFSSEELTILTYEGRTVAERDVVSRFCNVIGIDDPRKRQNPSFHNQSMSKSALYALILLNSLRIVRHDGRHLQSAHKKLVKWCRQTLPSELAIDATDFAPQCNFEDYPFLSKELGISYERPAPVFNRLPEETYRLDPDSISLLQEYLDERELAYDASTETGEAMAAIYHLFVADEFVRSQVLKISSQSSSFKTLKLERDQAVADRDAMEHALNMGQARLDQCLENPFSACFASVDYLGHLVAAKQPFLPRQVKQRMQKSAEKRRDQWLSQGRD